MRVLERRALQSTVAAYPYLQGLWAVPLGIVIAVSGVMNLQAGPSGLALLAVAVGGLAVAAGTSALITRYYRETYGRVTPTRGARIRYGLAVAAWAAVLLVGGNHRLWSPDPAQCLFAVAFALATLAFYAITVGLRAHHLVLWAALAVAGLLPVWGGLGADRDALAMLPLGAALVVSGLLDQRLLARALGSPRPQDERVDA